MIGITRAVEPSTTHADNGELFFPTMSSTIFREPGRAGPGKRPFQIDDHHRGVTFWAECRQFDLVDRDQLNRLMHQPVDSSTLHVESRSSRTLIFPKRIESVEIAITREPELRDALRDLAEASAEALEEEFPRPSDLALANARRLLPAMYKLSPRRFEVYPTPDGEIAIDARGGRGRSVLLLCESKGGALCLVNMNGRHRRARYSNTGLLPDGFVREALVELRQRDELAA